MCEMSASLCGGNGASGAVLEDVIHPDKVKRLKLNNAKYA